MLGLKKEKIDDGKMVYEKDPSKKETTPGIYVSAGEISQDYDKVDWKTLLEDYTNIRNGGAVESTTVSILKYPILRAGYAINHSDEKIVKYCEWVFDNLVDSFGEKDGFYEFLNHLFLALEFGCSFFEKVYSIGVYTPDGVITNVIKRLAPFKAETIWKFHYNDDMQFSGITHERRKEDGANEFIPIPISKLFFYAHNAEYGDPRGRSELRPIRNLYNIKKDILLATARAQQRGAGIPEVKAKKSGLTDAEKKRMEAVGRSIGNMKNGYVSTDADFDIKIHSLQSQGSPEALLELITREMFFNTLSEFMTSGIGQNGSRSATSEHKGSYELKCGVVTLSVEKRINLLLREIIDISCFAGISEYPTFKFNALQQTDIVSAADSIIKFYDKAILQKQDGDEDFIRSLFNMPEKKIIEVTPVSQEIKPDENKLSFMKQLDSKKFKSVAILSSVEQLDFIKKSFDVTATENLYLDMQKEAEAVILDVMNKYILYLAKQADSGKAFEKDIKYDVELSNRLNKIFKKGYSEGVSAFNKELSELTGKKLDSGKPTDDLKKGVSQSLLRYSGRLLYNIKTVVEDKLETEWNKENSAVEYVIEQSFDDGFKTDRRTLIDKTSDGYLIGRSDTLDENKDKIELFFYNSILDKNLCDTCAKLTGAVMTLEEAQSLGLKTRQGRVNPACLGSIDKCRCVLMPYKIKGDFIV